jgi:excisionase family DNA binding protein
VIAVEPGGRALALTLAEVEAARARAVELGFGPATAAPVPSTSEPLIDSRQLAKLTGCGAKRLESMARAGTIPSVRIGRSLRFDAAAVLRALRP